VIARVLALAALLLPSAADAGGLSVIGKLVRDADLAPGGTTSGVIVVSNSADEAQEVVAYVRDYRFKADGSNDYAEIDSHPRSAGAWLTLSPTQVSVPPGESVPLSYALTVPVDGDLIGTYWAAIMIEPFLDRSVEPQTERGVTVQTLVRYAVQVSASVGEAPRSLRFADIQVVPGKAGNVLQVDVENNGQTYLNTKAWVELFGSDGASHGRITAGEGRTYPGCSLRFRAPLPALSPGSYTALLVADSGQDDVLGTQIVLDIE
jgi:hypothetical protein